jgi:hypothetical protein
VTERSPSGSRTIRWSLRVDTQDIADYLQAEAERLERHDVLKFLAEKARRYVSTGETLT